MKRTIFTMAMAAMIAAAPAGAANLLVNGSFAGTVAHPFPGGIPSLPTGSTAIEGWTTFGNSDIAWIPVGFSTASQDDSPYLELMGYTDNPTRYGGVTQTIATQAGGNYSLSFWLGRNPGDAATIQVKASAGDTNQSFSSSTLSGAWIQHVMNFTATGASTAISIEGISGTFHIGIDNVVVDGPPGSAVPEPASWAMMLAGMGAIGAAMRRRPALARA